MSLDSDVKLLAALPIFASLDAEALRLIAFAAETRTFMAGDALYRQGQLSFGGYVIVSGAVALDSSQNGGVAAKIVGPGALLGESALLVPTRNPVTAIARQNVTVIKISRALFLRTLAETPASAHRLKTELGRELKIFVDDLEKTRKSFLD
jgi:CRP-like cAMP-binding protein